MLANIFVKMHNFEVVCHDSNILDEVKNNEELNLSSQKNLLGHKPMTFSRLQPEQKRWWQIMGFLNTFFIISHYYWSTTSNYVLLSEIISIAHILLFELRFQPIGKISKLQVPKSSTCFIWNLIDSKISCYKE